ncbi:MAG: hypothetical protein ABI836_08915 [Gemmatimonadota bacterium]
MYSIRNRPPSRRPVHVESLPIQAKKPWGGLGTSVAFHAVLIVMVLGLFRQKTDQLRDPFSSTPMAEPVQMVYLPTPPRPVRPVQRPAPDAVHAATEREARTTDPDLDRPPEMTPETPQAAAPRPREPDPQPVLAQRPPEPEPTETLEEESQRLFGRPLLRQSQENPTQLGIRPGLISNRDEAARTTCMPKPRDPNAPLEMATLIGRVFMDRAHSRPLAGAFLQIIGTEYSTYSDGTGVYRLVFDASLVDECRTQYVRVVANGYRGQNLVLGIGPGVNDVVLGR